MKQLLNETETCEYTSMSRSWLRQARCYQWPDSPPYIKIGRAIRYRVCDLDTWINARTVNPQEQSGR